MMNSCRALANKFTYFLRGRFILKRIRLSPDRAARALFLASKENLQEPNGGTNIMPVIVKKPKIAQKNGTSLTMRKPSQEMKRTEKNITKRFSAKSGHGANSIETNKIPNEELGMPTMRPGEICYFNNKKSIVSPTVGNLCSKTSKHAENSPTNAETSLTRHGKPFASSTTTIARIAIRQEK